MFEVTPTVKTLLSDIASTGYCVMTPPSARVSIEFAIRVLEN